MSLTTSTAAAAVSDQQTSMTELRELTMILLDIILEKSFLLWILKSETNNIPAPYWSNRPTTRPRNDDFIKSLASVNFCWFQRIKKRSFKKGIWLQLKDVYGKTRRGSIVIRNNRNYFLENMQPNEELFASMEKTDEQSFFIRRQRYSRDKNAELLKFLISCRQTLPPVFMYSLRLTNQKSVARILEEGGVVIKVEVMNNFGATCKSCVNPPLHETINDTRTRTKQRSQYTDELMNHLNEVGAKIISSQLDRQTEVVWIWCRSQAAIETIKKLYELNQLKDVINTELENTGTSSSNIIDSKVISIDSHQLNHTIAVGKPFANVPETIDVGRNENVRGVTILRNEIYVLCPSFSYPGIRVFRHMKSYLCLVRKIKIKEIKSAVDIESSEKDDCLYVADFDDRCVWKITKETDKKHRIVKWLIMDYNPITLSVSRDGQLLVLNVPLSILNTYGSEAKLLRSIHLQSDIVEPRHAVETSIGTFIILHQTMKTKDDGTISLRGRREVRSWVISKVTSDGQIVIRRFFPSNETQTLDDPSYLTLDLDDQVFVADYGNERVILLESNLIWIRIFYPSERKRGGDGYLIRRPKIVHFDKKRNTLLVGSNLCLRKANISRRDLKRIHFNDARVSDNVPCHRLQASVTGLKVRAVQDFNPKQMKDIDHMELEHILNSRRLVDFPFTETVPLKAQDDLEIIPPSTIEKKDNWWKVRHLKSGRKGFIPINCLETSADDGKLKAKSDFNPMKMAYSEIIELENELRSERHVEYTRSEKARIGLCEEWFIPGEIGTHLHKYERSHLWRSDYGRKISDRKEYKLDNKLMQLRNIGGSQSEETKVGSRIDGLEDQLENDLPILDIQKYRQIEFKETEQESMKEIVEKQDDGNSVEFEQKEENQRATSIDLDETYNPDYAVDPWKEAITLKKGDVMETIPPANIGDIVRWWMVRHLNTGKIGFILRNSVVVEGDQQPSKTRLNDLPLELLDIILETSFMHRMLNSSPRQTHKDVNIFLASVDHVWFQRMKTRRFMRRIQRMLKDLRDKPLIYEIIRINRIYLLKNIKLSEEFIASLLSENCITKEQSNLIHRHVRLESRQDKLLFLMKSFDETKFSNFVRCLRQTKSTNQMLVARIVENGGVVVKVTVIHNDATGINLHQKIEELRNRTETRSQKTEDLLSQLADEDLEILHSELYIKIHRTIVWIWCRSQAALRRLQKLYESNLLRDVLLGLAEFQPSTSAMNPLKVIKIDSNIFKKTAVVRPLSVKLIGKIDKEHSEQILGSTKLSNKIYILYQPSRSGDSNLIRVYEDRNPFSLQQKIEIAEVVFGNDISSSETENCLYVVDRIECCIWKVTRETDDEHKVTKWLITNYRPATLSVSSGGQLLMVNRELRTLMIYGSSGKLIRSIQLPEDITVPIHAVETSIGNVIILHGGTERKEIEGIGPSGVKIVKMWLISELIKDGDKVICRFIPSNFTQELSSPQHLSLDSDDQVFVADFGRNRVILLNSYLKWNRVLCRSKDEAEEIITEPFRLFYDKEMKQLIVGRFSNGEGVNVYSLS